MAYGILGQVKPGAAAETDLYAVPELYEVAVSSIVVCNSAAAPDTFRIAVCPEAGATGDESYLFYDKSVPANDSVVIAVGITLNETDTVRVYSAIGTLSFNIFGIIKNKT